MRIQLLYHLRNLHHTLKVNCIVHRTLHRAWCFCITPLKLECLNHWATETHNSIQYNNESYAATHQYMYVLMNASHADASHEDASHADDDDCHHDGCIVHKWWLSSWWLHRTQMMMIASYTDDDDRHRDDDCIVHKLWGSSSWWSSHRTQMMMINDDRIVHKSW